MHGQHKRLALLGRQFFQRGLHVEVFAQLPEPAVGVLRHFLAVALGKRLEAHLPAHVVQPRVPGQRIEERRELRRRFVFVPIVP